MKYKYAVDKIDTSTGHGKILSQIRPNSIVLECGCATGYITKFLKEQLGCKVYIVEYERDAFDIAKEFAEEGICADLTQASWTEAFEGIQFDYILFMDVLEHLYNPQEVLLQAEKLLKFDGSILISLPNIAHNDVLINLYYNAFNYLDLGLLDNTHIRFFAKNNISTLFDNSELRMVGLDYTYSKTGRSEQFWERPCKASFELLDVLAKRQYGDVYQFIITAKKTAYCEEHGIILTEIDEPSTTTDELVGIQEIYDQLLEVKNFSAEIEARYNELKKHHDESNNALLHLSENIQKSVDYNNEVEVKYEKCSKALLESERKAMELEKRCYELTRLNDENNGALRHAEDNVQKLMDNYMEATKNLVETSLKLQCVERNLQNAEERYQTVSQQYEQALEMVSGAEQRVSAAEEKAAGVLADASKTKELKAKCRNLALQYEEAVSARQAAERMVQIVRQSYEPMETHYNKIIRSRGWRFLNYMYKVRNMVLPMQSRRYKIIKAIFRPLVILRRKFRNRRLAALAHGSAGESLAASGSTAAYQPMPADQAFELFKTCRRIDIMAVGHTAYIAELLQGILLDAGLESCIHLTEPEQYENIPYIMICPQNFKHFPPVYIAFQMEQTVSARWLTDEYLQILRNAYAIFDYSLVNIKYFSNDPSLASKLYYIPIDACRSMMNQHPDENEKEYDVLFYGAPFIERRQEFLKPIGEKFNFRMIYDKFGTELYEEMKKARIVVNVHYYQNALLETTRIYETLSVSDCLVISERSTDPKEEERLKDIVDFTEIGDVQGMLDRISYWLEHDEERKEKAAKNRQELKNRANSAKFFLYRFLLANECITFDRFYNSVGNFIHFNGNRICLSLPESIARHEAFEADNQYGFEFFPGLKHKLGWIGCGMSYKFMFRKAIEQELDQILICEDDVYFPPDFEDRFNRILSYIESNHDWTVFSGIMADLGRVKPLKYIEENGEEYIYLNKMISMVFNLYDKSIFEAISNWDNMNRDVQKNTIDRYLENREMRILTTCPFLVGHKEDLCSTIWGGQNTIYSDLITSSSVKLREIVEKFKKSQL